MNIITLLFAFYPFPFLLSFCADGDMPASHGHLVDDEEEAGPSRQQQKQPEPQSHPDAGTDSDREAAVSQGEQETGGITPLSDSDSFLKYVDCSQIRSSFTIIMHRHHLSVLLGRFCSSFSVL